MERDCIEDFARAILRAQELREESYSYSDAEKEGSYALSHQQAANMAAEEFGFDLRATIPIFLLNAFCWNDIQIWANKPSPSLCDNMKSVLIGAHKKGKLQAILDDQREGGENDDK